MSQHDEVATTDNTGSSGNGGLHHSPVEDPGHEEHLPRLTDIDEKAANRAARQVTFMFGLVPVFSIAFVVIYFAVPRRAYIDFGPLHANASHVLLGLTLGLAVLMIGLGAVQWARQLMGDHEMVDERHPAVSSDEDREAVLADVNKGLDETGLSRRKMIGRSLLGALGIIAVPAVVTLADMTPVYPTKKGRAATIERTIFDEASPETPIRLVNDVTYEPIRPADMEIGQLVNAQPENLQDFHGHEFQTEKAKSSIIIVRMNPQSIKVPESRKDWHVGGILCYSKICTHVGCPISLWEQQTHHLLCPCHQSTFDLGDSGVVVFGPAKRSLPQLPIVVDEDGYLAAPGDFTVPVGPSYFERDSRNDFEQGDQ